MASMDYFLIYIYMYMYMFYNKKYGKIRFTELIFFSMTIWRFICCHKYYIKINNRSTVKKGRNLTESEEESTDDDKTTQSLDVVDHGWGFFLDKQIVYIMFIIYHLSLVKYLFGPILPRHHSACNKETIHDQSRSALLIMEDFFSIFNRWINRSSILLHIYLKLTIAKNRLNSNFEKMLTSIHAETSYFLIVGRLDRLVENETT
jgi:hypothetical protein